MGCINNGLARVYLVNLLRIPRGQRINFSCCPTVFPCRSRAVLTYFSCVFRVRRRAASASVSRLHSCLLFRSGYSNILIYARKSEFLIFAQCLRRAKMRQLWLSIKCIAGRRDLELRVDEFSSTSCFFFRFFFTFLRRKSIIASPYYLRALQRGACNIEPLPEAFLPANGKRLSRFREPLCAAVGSLADKINVIVASTHKYVLPGLRCEVFSLFSQAFFDSQGFSLGNG